MDWRGIAFSHSRDEALAIIPGVVQTEEKAMHAIAQNGTAENRVRQALSEERVKKQVVIPWGLVIETGLIVVALMCLVWSLWH